MDFNLSEEQVLLRDALRRFLSERHDLEHRRRVIGGEAGWSSERWADYAEFGWLALRVPEAHGGLGCSAVEMGLMMEEMGRALALEPVLPSAVLATQLLRACGGPLAERLLPQMAAGEAVLAVAHLESDLRHRGGRIATTLSGAAGSQHLSGHKLLVLGAPGATHLIVSARQAGERALFVIEAGRPGVALRPYRLVDGRMAADALLEGVAVSPEDRLAVGPAAEQALEEALDWAALGLMAEAVGAMEACQEITADYLKTRVQFKQPIGRFQALQHLMADGFVDAQEARSMLYAAYAVMDAPAAQRRQTVAAAQLVVTEAGRRVSSQALQMHGGYGMTDEYRISHHFRQLLVLSKLFGDSADALERMAPMPSGVLNAASA
jgi:alkylation response protein AidB-like acyl-CoA dehydrogenase